MSRVYILLLAVAAILVSSIGAFFSVTGLAKLFSGAAFSVVCMAASLEFAKFVAAGFLYRYWGHINRLMRIYLSGAVVILMGITSMGIFGYLSNAYQKSALALKHKELQLQTLELQDKKIHEEMERIQASINEIPLSRITRKLNLQKDAEPEFRRLSHESFLVNESVQKLKVSMLDEQTEVGPVIYVAEALHVPMDVVARWLILLFVSVFDPLAICLVFATNLAIRLREKYRGNESKIGAHALTTPVDHRLRKTG